MPPFVPPRVAIVSVHRLPTATEIVVEGTLKPYRDALAPGGLYSPEDDRHQLCELHKLVGVKEEQRAFRVYHASDDLDRLVGRLAVFRPWYEPRVLDLARDTSIPWVRDRYAGTGHDHCLLTWKALHPGDEGYRKSGSWITPQAYAKYIEQDYFRLREDG